MEHSSPLPRVLPVSQARSTQDTPLPGVRVPHSSGLTPWGRVLDSFMGGEVGPGGRRGGGQGKVQHRPTQPTVPTALGPRSWAGENNRVPRAVNTRWAKESPSTSLGSNGRRGHHCGHRRNCKKPVRSQQTVMGLGSFTVK